MVANLGLHNGGPGKRRLANEQYDEEEAIENEQTQVTKASKEESNEDKEIKRLILIVCKRWNDLPRYSIELELTLDRG